jgi:hypothetical protein
LSFISGKIEYAQYECQCCNFRILEVYKATKIAYSRAPKTIEVLSRINEEYILKEEQASEEILNIWKESKK